MGRCQGGWFPGSTYLPALPGLKSIIPCVSVHGASNAVIWQCCGYQSGKVVARYPARLRSAIRQGCGQQSGKAAATNPARLRQKYPHGTMPRWLGFRNHLPPSPTGSEEHHPMRVYNTSEFEETQEIYGTLPPRDQIFIHILQERLLYRAHVISPEAQRSPASGARAHQSHPEEPAAEHPKPPNPHNHSGREHSLLRSA